MSHDPTLGARRARWVALFLYPSHLYQYEYRFKKRHKYKYNTNTQIHKYTNTNPTLGARRARWALSFCLSVSLSYLRI